MAQNGFGGTGSGCCTSAWRNVSFPGPGPEQGPRPGAVPTAKRGPCGTPTIADAGQQHQQDPDAALVDKALEALDTLGQDAEEALHDLRPLLGIHLLGSIHRALHIGEQHRHVLALALGRRGTLRTCDAPDELKQDAFCDVIEEFLTGQRPPASDVDRVLATVLFTDIVDSTRGLGLEIRPGLHTGEVELRGDDVSGLAVHIGARIGAFAGAGEVLLSGTVRDLVVGSGLQFDERGEHELRGIDGRWRLLAVRLERSAR